MFFKIELKAFYVITAQYILSLVKRLQQTNNNKAQTKL